MARYRSFRPGAGGYSDNTDTWAAGGRDRHPRVFTVPDGLPRPGGPQFRPYVYRGTGADVLTAFMDTESERFGPGRPVSQPCGTPAAYRRHYRHGEQPCAACKQAEKLRLAQARKKVSR